MEELGFGRSGTRSSARNASLGRIEKGRPRGVITNSGRKIVMATITSDNNGGIASAQNVDSRGNPNRESGSGADESAISGLPRPVTGDLVSLLQCPICHKYMKARITQCQNGHLLCSDCRSNLSCCPTCKKPFGKIRNLGLGKVASTFRFKCKFSESGCSASFLHAEKGDHEKSCEYRPYSCPCPGTYCKWNGSLDQVMPHLLASHLSIITVEAEDVVILLKDIYIEAGLYHVILQSCFGYNFLIIFDQKEKYFGNRQVFVAVQLIGSKKQAELFTYKIVLKAHKNRLTWVATPRSIREGSATAALTSNSFVIDKSHVQRFKDNDDLEINVIISMVDKTEYTGES